MKRSLSITFLGALALSIMLASSADALQYQVYRQVVPEGSAKLATNGNPPNIEIAEIVDPEQDSTITVLEPGDRTEIADLERVYLTAGDHFFSSIGQGVLVFYAPGAKVYGILGTKMRVGVAGGALTQLLGPGPEYESEGLMPTGETTITNTVIAGHDCGIWFKYAYHSITGRINTTYLTNTNVGIEGLADYIENDNTVRLELQNLACWKNTLFDLSFGNITGCHTSLLAIGCRFLSPGYRNIGPINIGSDYDAEDKLKYTAEFDNCVLAKSAWTWENTWERTFQNDGVVIFKETRPGRSDLAQVWPLTAPLNPADFDVNGQVDLADFRLLAGNLLAGDSSQSADSTAFGRLYDLNQNSWADWADFGRWVRSFFGLDENAPSGRIVTAMATDTTASHGLLRAFTEYPIVMELVLADPDLGPILQDFLRLKGEEPSVDFDDNGWVELEDFLDFAENYGRTTAGHPELEKFDLNHDGRISLADIYSPSLSISLFISHWGKQTKTDAAPQMAVTPEQINRLRVTVDEEKSNVEWLSWLPTEVEEFLRPTAITEEQGFAGPQTFALEPNYPNPFNPTTTISFSLPERMAVEVAVYNLAGQSVKILLADTLPAGVHQLQWDGAGDNGQAMASGLYLCVLRADGVMFTTKMTLLR